MFDVETEKKITALVEDIKRLKGLHAAENTALKALLAEGKQDTVTVKESSMTCSSGKGGQPQECIDVLLQDYRDAVTVRRNIVASLWMEAERKKSGISEIVWEALGV